MTAENDPSHVCQDAARGTTTTTFNEDATMNETQLSEFIWGLTRSIDCAMDIAAADRGRDKHVRPAIEHAIARAQTLHGMLFEHRDLDLSKSLPDLGHRSAWQVVNRLREVLYEKREAAKAIGWRVAVTPAVKP